MNTRCGSWATPIAATCSDRWLRLPDRGRIRSILRSGLQPHHRDVVGLGERGHPPAERVPDLLQARRGWNRITKMIQELDHLPAHLQMAE